MAKKGNKQKAPQPSFFKQQEQRYGADFINRITPDTIRKNALKIFRDLSYGAINPDKDYIYFNVYDFTYNLLLASNDNARYNWCCYHGLTLSPYIQQDVEMQKIATSHFEHYKMYTSISSHLNNILYNISFYDGVYTRLYLEQLIAELRWQRNIFGGYFITIEKDTDKKQFKQERRPHNDKRFHNKSEEGFFG